MSSETIKTYSSNDNRKVVISNQEVTTRKWKFDTIFKVILGILYGFFFGMLSASFYFNNNVLDSQTQDVPTYEIVAIISLLSIGLVSIGIIFWLFKGNIKRHHPLMYRFVHILNGILLSIGILVVTILYPDSKASIEASAIANLDRYMVLGISYGAYSIIISIVIISVLAYYRKQYPLSWSKTFYAVSSFVFVSIVNIFIYFSVNATNEGKSDQELMWLIVALASFVVSVILLGFGIVFVKRFRDILLGEITDNEIELIRDWESARVLSIIICSVSTIVYSIIVILKSNATFDFSLPIIIEIVIDAVLLLPYISIISYIKIQNINNSNKSFFISKVFKSIDNGLFLDITAWIIIAKLILLQGIYLDDTSSDLLINQISRSVLSLASFGTLFVLYSFTIMVSLNVPNLKNRAISLPTLLFSVVFAVFVILFSVYLSAPNLTSGETVLSSYIFLFMPIVLLIGVSISLIAKIIIIAKIFKVNWTKPEVIDKSYLAAQQEQEDNNFIGEKTIEVDPESIKIKSKNNKSENKEAIKEGLRR